MLPPSGDHAGAPSGVPVSWDSPDPSAPIVHRPPLANTIVAPSGDHAGVPPKPSARAPVPSAFMTITVSPSEPPLNAIRPPSGDQTGQLSPSCRRSVRSPEPSGFIE